MMEGIKMGHLYPEYSQENLSFYVGRYNELAFDNYKEIVKTITEERVLAINIFMTFFFKEKWSMIFLLILEYLFLRISPSFCILH